ncbi:hypothetical protein Pmar_PMAR011411 [Perkinsus marinus ATCC 50983]|uniref:Uncharacterized protein n=1 Tax=Perkinsus marinus (strain ATCC 50983 / TXsc) TaxID=423536 RepID=C5LPP7_PERM5|nr:hypothetical protein Pmar_PMAR011411 [Perkinsus marinus ATCC 50983]EER01295.1 hypothetical protein Pmar_PMAR011411 [Perkinsus marinus ATCC 50983]|eukprot:XP_002768577.1 hypothetical protein Pmar_PMAR011411 [Perkinsus marinus ATCC 50983]
MNLLTDTTDGREDIEINDLRVGANRIIEIMQKEIKDYEAHVTQLRMDNDELRLKLTRGSNTLTLPIHVTSPVSTIPKKEEYPEFARKDSSTSPMMPYPPQHDQQNREIIEQLREDNLRAQQKLEVSERERKRLEEVDRVVGARETVSLQSIKHGPKKPENVTSPTQKQMRMLKRQVVMKSAEISRMREVLDELKKETIRLVQRREEHVGSSYAGV